MNAQKYIMVVLSLENSKYNKLLKMDALDARPLAKRYTFGVTE